MGGGKQVGGGRFKNRALIWPNPRQIRFCRAAMLYMRISTLRATCCSLGVQLTPQREDHPPPGQEAACAPSLIHSGREKKSLLAFSPLALTRLKGNQESHQDQFVRLLRYVTLSECQPAREDVLFRAVPANIPRDTPPHHTPLTTHPPTLLVTLPPLFHPTAQHFIFCFYNRSSVCLQINFQIKF